MRELGIIILAAGVGKRMKSKLPKVLHNLCGRPMLSYVVDTGVSLNPTKTVIVVGRVNDKIRHAVANPKLPLQFIIQDPPRGTGDAVLCAEPAFRGFNGSILVLCGDVPLLKLDTINKLIEFHSANKGVVTVLTAIPPDPGSYGRVVKSKIKNQKSKIKRIVEVSDAPPRIKKIREINTGIYVFDKSALFSALHKIKPSNVQCEYYLTDTIEVLSQSGKSVYGYSVSDWHEVIGINTMKALAEVESILQAQIIGRHQLNGVTIKKPETVVIDFDVKIGKDTIIHPGVELLGNTQIGEDCEIGANTIIMGSKISSGTKMGESSTIKDAIL